jgi:hypothetical protein
MLKATSLAAYRDVKDYTAPEGVQSVLIDPESLQLATPNCPTTREEVYVAGSAPTDFCELHGGRGVIASTGSWLAHVFGGESKQPQTDASGNPGAATASKPYDPNRPPSATGQGTSETTADPDDKEKKKSPLKKIFGIFGGKKKDPDKAKAKPEKGDSP